MIAKYSTVILSTALFLVFGINYLIASEHNSNEEKATHFTLPRNDDIPPEIPSEHKPSWVIQAEKKLEREEREERWQKEQYGKIRPRTSVQ